MTYEYNRWLDENANEEERQKYDILATLPFYDASGGPCYTPLPLKYKIPNKELFTLLITLAGSKRDRRVNCDCLPMLIILQCNDSVFEICAFQQAPSLN